MFIGSETGPEGKIVEAAGWEFEGLPAAPLRRSLPGMAKAVGSAGAGVARAMSILRRFQPDVVIGTGGYASFAAGLAAGILRIPLVLEAPDAVPGKATRLLAPLASRICTAIPGAERRLPGGKIVHTGFPIRKEIMQGSEVAARRRWDLDPDRPVMLVYGGSQGAHTLNQATLAGLPNWTTAGIQVLHSAGRKLYDGVAAEGEAWRERGYRLVPYIDGMADAYAAADLVVCRGGASSIAEVTACGKPGIYVPYPHHADRHQEVNALAVEAAGAGLMVLNGDAVAALPGLVVSLMGDAERCRRTAAASRAFGKPDAAEAIAKVTLSILDFGF